jgi:probable HAF family extracellular repeat protein
MRMTIRRWQAALMGGVVLGWLGGARVEAYAQSLLWLGALDGRASEARGVSADGTVVVGIHYNQNDNPRAFRWTRTGGMELLPNLGGLTSAAHAVSADGVLTVGWADDERGYPRAALWIEDGGGFFPTPFPIFSEAYAIDPDATHFAGYAYNRSYTQAACLWDGGIYQDLGALPGSAWSEARGLSENGQVAVGFSSVGNDRKPVRWVNGVIQPLGYPQLRSGWAAGVSADGRAIAGTVQNFWGEIFAVRWVDGVAQTLGRLPDYSFVGGISADGQTVVGEGGFRAFRWTPTRGLEDLNRAFRQVVGNSVLEYAYAVSPDGRYIVGQGRDAESGQYLAYLLDTWRTGDTNGDGCIDDADLLAVLFAFGGAGTGNTRHEDIDKDGIVDDADLLAVLFAFGQGCN